MQNPTFPLCVVVSEFNDLMGVLNSRRDERVGRLYGCFSGRRFGEGAGGGVVGHQVIQCVSCFGGRRSD